MEIKSKNTYLKVEDIMSKDLKEIKLKIMEVMALTKGEECFICRGDFCKNILNNIYDYAKENDNVFDKIWTLQGILDNVLSVYFQTLEEVEKRLNEVNEMDLYNN